MITYLFKKVRPRMKFMLLRSFPVKHGTVAQIHTRSCPRSEDGSFASHRCKGSWRYTLEYGREGRS